MNNAVTIDTFYAQLTSAEDNALLEALRSLMNVKKEDLLAMIETNAISWSGWPL